MLRPLYCLINLHADAWLVPLAAHLGDKGAACLFSHDGSRMAHQTQPYLAACLQGCQGAVVVCGQPLKQFLAKRIAMRLVPRMPVLLLHAYRTERPVSSATKAGLCEHWLDDEADGHRRLDAWLTHCPPAAPSVPASDQRTQDLTIEHFPVSLRAAVYRGGNNARQTVRCDVSLADLLLYLAHEVMAPAPLPVFRVAINRYFQGETWRGRLAELFPEAHAVGNISLAAESLSMIFSALIHAGLIQAAPLPNAGQDAGRWHLSPSGHQAVQTRYLENASS